MAPPARRVTAQHIAESPAIWPANHHVLSLGLDGPDHVDPLRRQDTCAFHHITHSHPTIRLDRHLLLGGMNRL